MPRAVSMVRQVTSAASAFVGAVAQLIVDTGLNVIRVHDGITPGGFPQLGANNNLSDLPNKALARTNLSVSATSATLLCANNLSDLVSAAAARGNLGLGSAALLASTAVCLTANNLSDVANVVTARGNLGLGTASTHATGDFLQTANNLSDVVAGTARGNLGLGTAAVQNIGTSGANVPLLNANGGTNVYSNSHIFTGVQSLRYDAGDASSHSVCFIAGTAAAQYSGRISYSTSGPSGTLQEGEIWLVYS